MTAGSIIPIVLSGGIGERLWPLSRPEKPKQFLKFGSQNSLIQDTVLRCKDPDFDPNPIIVSSESQRFLVAEDMRSIGVAADIVLEPMRRDSCAAVVAGCLVALQRDPDAMVLVLAADHRIIDDVKFREAVLAARADADRGYLMTFGIRPTYPATGYGYLKLGALLQNGCCNKVEKFVEKPNFEIATEYIKEGYLWNSGNFLFQAQSFITEVRLYAPKIYEAVKNAVDKIVQDTDFLRLDPDSFAASPKISIDFAIMEKTKKAAVFAADYGWTDIGGWDSVYDLLEKDGQGNVVQGEGQVNSGRNNLIFAENILTAVVDVDDVFVIATPSAVLVTKKGTAEKLKIFLSDIKKPPKT